MKGLLIKDISVLKSQMLFFILAGFLCAAIPNSMMSSFAIIYTAMLPYSALAYDERSKWDHLAAMMPYSVRDIVLSKYVLGYVSIIAASLVTVIVKLVVPGHAGELQDTLLVACFGFLMMALTLPFMFRFGVEKGRVFIIFGMVILAVGGTNLVLLPNSPFSSLNSILNVFVPILAVVGSAISVFISIKLYPKRSV